MVAFFKEHMKGAALSAASVIVFIQLILPGLFDFIFDLMMLGLLWFVMKLNDSEAGVGR